MIPNTNLWPGSAGARQVEQDGQRYGVCSKTSQFVDLLKWSMSGGVSIWRSTTLALCWNSRSDT